MNNLITEQILAINEQSRPALFFKIFSFAKSLIKMDGVNKKYAISKTI